MGARTRTLGGSAAGTGVSDAWNQFLFNNLTGMPGNLAGAGPVNQTAAQAAGQNSNFSNMFRNAMSGNVTDQSGANAALRAFFQNPTNNFSLPQQGNTYTPANFQGVDLSQLPTNFGANQTGMADLSRFGNAATAGFDVMQGFGNQASSPLTAQLQAALASIGNAAAPTANASMASVAGPASLGMRPELASGMDWRTAFNMMGEDPMQRRIEDRSAADLRARFGAEGAGALGTGAQFAESNLRAELAAQDASKRRMEALQLMQQDLAERGTSANVALQGRGQDSQYNLGNRGIDANLAAQNADLATRVSMGNAANALQNSLTNSGNALQAILSARGQDFNNQLGNRNADISQLGLGNQQSMFNAGQQNDMQTALMNAVLQNQGLGNSFGLNAAQLNNAAMQSNNANALNQNQFMNTFNQNNAQNTAQFGQAANALNSQNALAAQGLNNNMLSNMINQGLNLNQLGNANQMALLAQLFGGFQQANGLNTAQRQVVQTPSQFGQIMNMLTQLGGAWLQGGGGNPFGNSGGGMTGANPQPAVLR